MDQLSDLADEWQDHLRASRKAWRTVKRYRAILGQYIQSQGSELPTRRSARSWLSSMGEAAPATQRLSYAVLSAFCRWLVDEGLLTEHPMKGMDRPQVKTEPVQPIAEDDVLKLTATCKTRSFNDVRDELIIQMLYGTGMRIGELAGIHLDHIDLKEQVIVVMGKGSKPRLVPYDDMCSLLLKRYIRARAHHKLASLPDLLLGERGPLSSTGIDNALRRRAKKAGITGLHAHVFRHSFADRWLSEGGSEVSLMALAGWSHHSMLQRYTAARKVDRALAEYRIRAVK